MVVVLFVCTGNAARSQMAEGWLKNLNSDISVISAGTKPEGVSKIASKFNGYTKFPNAHV